MNATLLLIAAVGVVLVALAAFFGRKNAWASKAMLAGAALTVLGFGAALLEQQHGKWVLWAFGGLGVALVALACVAWTKGRKQPWVVGLGMLLGLVGFAGLGWAPGANTAIAQVNAVTNAATGAVGNLAGDAAASTPTTEPSESLQTNTETASATQVATDAVQSNTPSPTETQTNSTANATTSDVLPSPSAVTPENAGVNNASSATDATNAQPTSSNESGNTTQTLAPPSTPEAAPSGATTSTEVLRQRANLREVDGACPCLVNIRVNAANPRLTLTQNGTVIASGMAQVSSLRLENAGEYILNVEATGHDAFSQTILVNKSLNLELDLAHR